MKKNIIWINFDSIRADRTPFGGHSRETMPVLEQFASGTNSVGTTCTSHGIWSLPSVASMMSGLWPSRHGTGLHNEVLPSEITTVAERLSEASYQTTGISTNSYFSPETGLDRGFDKFQHLGIKELFREAGISGTLSFARNIRRYSGGLTLERGKHSSDFLLNKVVRKHIESLSNSNEPFALFAHYLGAHHPYYPSPAFRDSFEMSESINLHDAVKLTFEATSDVYSTIAGSNTMTEQDWEAMRTVYDALLLQVDALAGEIINIIDDLGLTDETIVVFTSDHGDLIGEYNIVSHKLFLHDSLIQVPVVVHGSDRLASSDTDHIQHIDVIQTILDEVGAPTDGMHGVSLPSNDRSFTIAQRGEETAERSINRIQKYTPEFNHHKIQEGLLTALRSDKWKIIKGKNDTVLYELPNETVDKSDSYPEQKHEYMEEIDNWVEEFGTPLVSDDQADFSESVKKRLAELGYVVR